jgi:hypothetical protein
VVFLSILHTSGGEPVTASILWVGANLGIEKIGYISFLNVFLISSLVLLVRKNQVRLSMIFLLLTNFYIFVLLTSAERLKIAYIFTIIAVFFVGKARVFLLAFTPFAHFQSVILLSCVALARFEGGIRDLIFNFCITKKSILIFLAFVSMGSIIAYFLYESIARKVDAYAELGSVSDLVNIMLLALIAVYVSRQRLRMLFLLLPLFPIILLIGATRVNMIAVSLVIYFLMIERRLHHPLIYLLMIYFSFKTIGYVDRILTTGHGF